MGRPRKEIDWAEVDKLCAMQATEEEIAQFLNISVDTLCRAAKREHEMTFAEYFAQKRGAGKTSLRRAQWLAATQDSNPTMLIWLGKQYLGQRDKTSTELSGPDGKPIETRSSLTDEQLEARLSAALAKVHAQAKADEP